MEEVWRIKMEEIWRIMGKLWASSRAQIAETYRHASTNLAPINAQIAETYRRASTNIDIERLRNSLVGHVRKNLFNYEKRKHEARASSGSEKQVKLKQVATRLRLGFLIFTFAVLGTLALPMMFEDMLPQQMEQEFGAGGTTNHDMGSGKDQALSRKIILEDDRFLKYEEKGNDGRLAEDQQEVSTEEIDSDESKEVFNSKEKTVKDIFPEKDVKILQKHLPSDPLRKRRRSGKLKLPGETGVVVNGDVKVAGNVKETIIEKSDLVQDPSNREGTMVSHSDSLGTRSAEKRLNPKGSSSTRSRRKRGKHGVDLLRGNDIIVDSAQGKAVTETGKSQVENEPNKEDSVSATVTEEQKVDQSALGTEAGIVQETKADVVEDSQSGISWESGSKESIPLVKDESVSTDGSIKSSDQWQQNASQLPQDDPENGSSKGMDAALEEVVKLDIETKKTASEHSSESLEVQQESVKKEEPELKSTGLDVGSSERADGDSQRILGEESTQSEKENSVEEVSSNKESVGPDTKTTLKENVQSFEEKEKAVGELPIDSKELSSKGMETMERGASQENREKPNTEDSSNLSDLHEGAHDDGENPGSGDKTGSTQSLVKEDSQKVDSANNQLVTDESKKTEESSSEKHEAGDQNLDGGGNIPHENNNKVVDDSGSSGVMPEEKPNGTADDQKLQVEVRHENSDEWPQESLLITSLREKSASGKLRVGLLNMEATNFQRWEFLAGDKPIVFPYERVEKSLEWKDLYPEWIDEEQKYGTPQCPLVPMPEVNEGVQLDVVIVHAPCKKSSSLPDTSYLQVLLGAATLAAKTGSGSTHVLILSECRPLVNLFTCGDLVEHRDQGWLYKVDVEQIRKHLSLPVGSCQLSVPLHDQGTGTSYSPKEAYATILHSGPDYVCGAIVAARSIRQTGSSRDLVILVDESILPEHRQALTEAGWKVKELEKIHNANTVAGKYSEIDFSKFRLWQLTEYSKVVYIDADLLILRNLDVLFKMPELSASGNTKTTFNSGVMVIEPSNCTFQLLMDGIQELTSDISNDQEFFNWMFPWWHRIPRHMNYLKYFWTRQANEVENMNRLFSAEPAELYAIHYWGYKPWQCYRDYDCNWNSNQQFASDEAHAQWFKVYDGLSEDLKQQCTLTTGKKAFLEHNRQQAEAAGFADKHWTLNITDPRITICRDSYCDWNALLLRWGENEQSTATRR